MIVLSSFFGAFLQAILQRRGTSTRSMLGAMRGRPLASRPRGLRAVIALVATLSAAGAARAQAPLSLSYQGRVSDASGALIGASAPVSRVVVFRIWNHSADKTAENLLYSEQQTVTIAQGEFSVLVGQGSGVTGTPLGFSEAAKGPPGVTLSTPTVLGGATRLLGITVYDATSGATAEILPRQQLVSSPFAVYAPNAESLMPAVGSGGITVGDNGNVALGLGTPTLFPLTLASGLGYKISLDRSATGESSGIGVAPGVSPVTKLLHIHTGLKSEDIVFGSEGGDSVSGLIALTDVGTTYVDRNADGGAWVLVAYGANARLNGYLHTASGSFNAAVRSGSATLAALPVLRKSTELAMSWTAAGGALPTGGFASYPYAIAFTLPAAAAMTFDGTATTPPSGNTSSSFSSIGTSPGQSLVTLRVIAGAPNLPAQMYLRNVSFGVAYGAAYGLVMNDGSNPHLDYGLNPDGQSFKAVYLAHGGASSTAQGLVMNGAGGANNSYVPSTMALWARLDAAGLASFTSAVVAGFKETMRIKGNGNVGIGTRTPGVKLDVAGVVRAKGGADGFVFGEGVNRAGLYSPAAGILTFNVREREVMRVDTRTGNVGLGVTAPKARLDVAFPSADIFSEFDYYTDQRYRKVMGYPDREATIRKQTNDVRYYYSPSYRPLGDSTYEYSILSYHSENPNFQENYGYYPANLAYGSYWKWTPIYYEGLTTPRIVWPDAYGFRARSSIWLSPPTMSEYIGDAYETLKAPLAIHSQGSIISKKQFVIYSDRRIKRDIEPSVIADDLAALRQLRVVDYRRVDTQGRPNDWEKGFIAQDVAKILPPAVSVREEFVPDVFALATSVVHDPVAHRLALTVGQDHGLKEGDCVRLQLDGARRDLKVAAIPSGRTFVVAECDLAPKQVFVYGKRVVDFLSVNYDYCFTVAVGALQGLKREKDAELAALQRDKAALLARLAAFQAREPRRDARLAALEGLMAERVRGNARPAALKLVGTEE